MKFESELLIAGKRFRNTICNTLQDILLAGEAKENSICKRRRSQPQTTSKGNLEKIVKNQKQKKK